MLYEALNDDINPACYFFLWHFAIVPAWEVEQVHERFFDDGLSILVYFLDTQLVGNEGFLHNDLRRLNEFDLHFVEIKLWINIQDGRFLRVGPVLHTICVIVIAHIVTQVDNQFDVLA